MIFINVFLFKSHIIKDFIEKNVFIIHDYLLYVSVGILFVKYTLEL